MHIHVSIRVETLLFFNAVVTTVTFIFVSLVSLESAGGPGSGANQRDP